MNQSLEELNSIDLPISSARSEVVRICPSQFNNPFFWSKNESYRFDSKTGRYGVLYTGQDIESSILECFGDLWLHSRAISLELVIKSTVWFLTVNRDLPMVDTTETNLNKLGLDSNFFASLDYTQTRLWARAFMVHPQKPSGIIYHSRKNPTKLNYAFFETQEAISSITAQLSVRLMHHALFHAVINKYDIALV